MAWRSSGIDNDGMVSNLKRFGVISSMTVEEGFRSVDRRLFVPKNRLEMAHTDRPLKEGNIHISAPHIYGTVLEALELRNDAPLSFLNVGSGTGYLSCIAMSILGPKSSHFCIEIYEDVIQHCNEAVAQWKELYPPAQEMNNLKIIHGNALCIDPAVGECALGFDRVYIGAAIEKHQLEHFKKLLKPGGILVGPVDDELTKVVRLQTAPDEATQASQYTRQILSGVNFAALVQNPIMKTTIPAQVWSPSVHRFYPDAFRDSCKTLLLCSQSSYEQKLKPRPIKQVNTASLLPRALWLEIFSYTHRDWFQAPQSELEFLRCRLKEEQANAERANLARLEADTRCHLAEKERDIYRLLARRWKTRLHSTMGQSSRMNMQDTENAEEEEAVAAILLGGQDPLSMLGLGNIFRQYRSGATRFQESDDDSELDDDDAQHDSDLDRMDEDEDDDASRGILRGTSERNSDSSISEHGPGIGRMINGSGSDMSEEFHEAEPTHESSQNVAIRRQVRSVSVTSEDV